MIVDTSRPRPLVSIGVPVFNEDRYILQALNSLLAQSYTNIEIIVSDNCSTDKTGELCAQLAQVHDHLSYHKQETNVGATANFNKVLGLSTGDYFMWASGHDLWDPGFIASCVDVYAKQDNAVLVFGDSTWIDEEGQRLPKEFGWSDTRGLHVVARYVTVFWGHMNPILGLIRRDVLEEGIMQDLVGTDLVILTRMAMRGDFVFADGAGWSRRDFRNEQVYAEKLNRYKSKEYGLAGQSVFSRLFPLFQLPLELLKAVYREESISRAERVLLLFVLISMFPFRYITGKYLR